MRLTVRREQMDVMSAVAEANFERRLAAHIRQSYPASMVKPPDGGEFSVSQLTEDALTGLVRAGIAKSRKYEMSHESSIAAFVALMFDVAPNFDRFRLCAVLLDDEEKQADLRIEDILAVLSEKNYEAIRNDYDPAAWIVAEDEAAADKSKAAGAQKSGAATVDPMMRTTSGKKISSKTLAGKTMSGKTMSNTVSRKSQTIKVQPEKSGENKGIDQNTILNIPNK